MYGRLYGLSTGTDNIKYKLASLSNGLLYFNVTVFYRNIISCYMLETDINYLYCRSRISGVPKIFSLEL